MFPIAAQGKHRLAVHQAEIRAAFLYLHIGQQIEKTIIIL